MRVAASLPAITPRQLRPYEVTRRVVSAAEIVRRQAPAAIRRVHRDPADHARGGFGNAAGRAGAAVGSARHQPVAGPDPVPRKDNRIAGTH